MSLVGTILGGAGGLWYVDQDDAERRLEKGKLWRKLSVRLAGTHGPKQEAALVNLRGWWEKWHSGDQYQEEAAKTAFEREVLDAFKLGAIGWILKEIDSWNGERGDGAILVAEKSWALKRFAEPGKEKPAPVADLMAVANFLDEIGKPFWHFLSEDMKKWADLSKNAYGDGGSGELLDRLESRENMKNWAEDRRLTVWNRFLDKVSVMEGGGWVREWCEAEATGLNEGQPCGNLLRGLAVESKRRGERQAWLRKLGVAVAVLSGVALLGVGIWGAVEYSRASKSVAALRQQLEGIDAGELEKLTAFETDLKASGGSVFLGKQYRALRFDLLNRLEEELEEQKREVKNRLKRGCYEEAANVCARVVACQQQRGEDSSEWEKMERQYRAREQDLANRLAHVNDLMNEGNYESARRELNEFDRLVVDEVRQQQKKELRERVNWEPPFWKRWEDIQQLAAPNKTLDDWQRALRELKEVETDIAMHPAVMLPTAEAMAEQRKALERRWGTWINANKLCGSTLKQWLEASPSDQKQLRDEVVRNLERCLDDLDGIYDENGGQPCGGAKMEKLYNTINDFRSKLLQE